LHVYIPVYYMLIWVLEIWKVLFHFLHDSDSVVSQDWYKELIQLVISREDVGWQVRDASGVPRDP